MKIHLPLFVLISILSIFSFSACKEVNELNLEGCDFSDNLDDYALVWSDEFEGEAIDLSKWSYDLGDGCDISPDLCGWGNNELEYYTNRPENAYLSDGNLVIKAIRESPLYLGQHQYTSARMVTKNKGDWKYGRIDVRARMPIGQGLWGAIWMLSTEQTYGGWPRSGEIDIMEYLGNAPNRVFGTIHYGHDYWRYKSNDYTLDSGSFNTDFHIFSLLWNENCIKFLVDGNAVGTPNTRTTTLPTTWPFDQNFHLLLNLAVGGNLPGNPNGSATFPQTMEVDYVRVYQ